MNNTSMERVWQYFLQRTKVVYIERRNGYIPSALMYARIRISEYSGEITRFIAYSESSG